MPPKDELPALSLVLIATLCDILQNDPEPSLRIDAAQALGEMKEQSAVAIYALLRAVRDDPDAAVRRTALKVLRAIAQQPQNATPSLLEKILDSLTQIQITLQRMADQPKVQMNFNAPVTSATGNVEGDLNIYAQEQDLTEAAAKIQALLAQLSQTYANESDRQVEAVKREAQRNATFRDRLLSAAKAGGVEAVKQLLDYVFKNPVATVVAESVKAFVEAGD
jgi:HEAT repeat protein